MKKRLFAILIAACCALVTCKRRAGEGLAPMPAMNRDPIKALGSTVPEPNYDRNYWLKQHAANTPKWQEAKRLCGQTVLANYPNCIPVNDIERADQRRSAEEGGRAAQKNDEMADEATATITRVGPGCPSATCKPLDDLSPIRNWPK